MENTERILLDGKVEVEARMSYRERARLLLERARIIKYGSRKKGYYDNKKFVYPEGIESLIGAGARIKNLNWKTGNEDYYHEVEYKSHTFISTTSEPYVFSIEGPLL